jgi:phospholipid-translocating ATPase
VGILGREGKSAAAASDFYFGQFKHLDRLLLHHGRWFYMRISYFFVYYGWKNLLMTVIMFLFITRSAYSGFPAFSEFFITMYNLVIGMYLIGYYGVWEQDINDDMYPDVWAKLPLLYKSDKERDLFSYKRYIIWTIMGIGIAVVLEYFVNISFAEVDSIEGLSGFPVTYDSLYLVKSASIIIITLLVVLIDLKTFTWYTITVAIGLFTLGFLVMIYLLENLSYFGRGYGSLVDNDSTKFYLVLLIVTGVTIAVKLIINISEFEIFPSEVDKILKEKSKKGFLSISNLNPHIHPKDLLMSLHSRFF